MLVLTEINQDAAITVGILFVSYLVYKTIRGINNIAEIFNGMDNDKSTW